MTYSKPTGLLARLLGTPRAVIGDMRSMPDPKDNHETPDRPAPVPLVVPAPTGPTTTRPDGTRIVGDMGGMPKVTENRGVPTRGPNMWTDSGANAEPTRQI